jgi:hypothetical protein
MIPKCIYADTKANRLYDPPDYIDEPFLNELWNDQSNRCFYENCRCDLSLEFTRNPNQISILRLDNVLPHVKSNCVLSCLQCNFSRKYNVIYKSI